MSCSSQVFCHAESALEVRRRAEEDLVRIVKDAQADAQRALSLYEEEVPFT